jgi:hypothetical protein
MRSQRARSSMVEQFPFKEVVLGSSPSGLTASMGSRLTVGQQPLELFILGSNPSSPAKIAT